MKHERASWLRSSTIAMIALAGAIFASSAGVAETCPDPVNNLLRVHCDNPRYLTDDSGRAILLTGSHTWAVFQDYSNAVPEGPDPAFNYDGNQGTGGYSDSWLGKLESWNHNFFRGWHWEDAYYEPWPYEGRASGGVACNPLVDSGCKFQLLVINQDYLDRLRQRVRAAADRGIYTSIMLFQGWSVEDKNGNRDQDPWDVHPYKSSMNWNPINGDPNGDGKGLETHDDVDGDIFDLQKAYVEAVVDEMAKDPVVWEHIIWQVSNESHVGSRDWQYDIVSHLQAYELANYNEKHLVWVDCLKDGADDFDNGVFDNGPAEIVSPCGRVDQQDNGYTTKATNPPPADGAKVILVDSDHTSPDDIDRPWVWKSFFRGLHPITMDAWTGLTWYPPGVDTNNQKLFEAREAMGGVNLLATTVDLAPLLPQGRGTGVPSSTQYSLARPDGTELLVYHPESAGDISVCTLTPGLDYRHEELVLTGGSYGPEPRPNQTVNGGGCINLSRGDGEDTVHWLVEDTPPVPVSPVTVVRDTFANSTGGDVLLDGRLAGAGGLTWEAASDLYVDPSGVVSSHGAVHAVGGVPFDPAVSGERVTLSAELDPLGSYWTAVGFSASATGNYNSDGQLWMYLRIGAAGNPKYWVRADGNTHQLASDSIPGYIEGELNRVELDYDPLTTAWALRINGVEVESGNVEADTGFVPDIEYAGMHIRYGTADSSRIDDFEVRREPMAVRDTFANSGGTEVPLDGRETGAGGLTWEAASDLYVDPSGVVSSHGAVHAVGGVPFDPAVSGERVTLSAELDPLGSYWTAVGFSASATGNYNSDGQLWMYLRIGAAGNPKYWVRADGNTHQLASDSIPGYIEGELNRVEFDYDPLTTAWALRINGVEVESGNVEADTGFVPDIEYAGMHIRYGTADSSRIDDFEVRREPMAVRDTFANSGGTQVPLDGREADAGGLTWEAASDLFVDPSGVVSSLGGVHEAGGVPFDPMLSGERVTLSAAVDHRDSYWTAVGFSKSADEAYNFDGQLWMYLRITTGGAAKYWVKADGNTHVLGSGAIPGYVLGELNRVELDYDPLTTDWALRINGVEVESGNVEADTGFVPDLQYAGMHLRYGTAGLTRVDDFEVGIR